MVNSAEFKNEWRYTPALPIKQLTLPHFTTECISVFCIILIMDTDHIRYSIIRYSIISYGIIRYSIIRSRL
jgi:hypothetical protein